MGHKFKVNFVTSTLTCCVALIGLTVNSGCQSSINGQTLPSAYYLDDDVQYFPAGPEFKLSREAEAIRATQQ